MTAVRSFGGLALACGLLAGCGGGSKPPGSNVPVQPVKGRITAGGQPLVGGLLKLALVTNNDKYGQAEAVGEIQADGSFEPKQVGDRAGLVPGKWKAYVEPVYVRDGKTHRVSVPVKYTRESTSDLSFEVATGDNSPTLAIP